MAHRFLLLILITLFLATCAAGQEPRKPLTVADILELVGNKVHDDVIIKHIQQYKVDFFLDQQNLDVLIKAGVTRRLRDVIEENPFQPLKLTFPNDGDQVSKFIRVEGSGRNFPDKHLWLFVHRKGESDWVPQANEIVPENTTWKHNVYVGQPQDVKAEFEIKAMWVDLRSHRALETYFQSQCRQINGEYPYNCPGIKLPEGTPTAQVTVMRLN